MLGYLYERFPKYIYFLCAVVIFSLTDACCAFLSSSKLPNVGKKRPNLGRRLSNNKDDNILKNVTFITSMFTLKLPFLKKVSDSQTY